MKLHYYIRGLLLICVVLFALLPGGATDVEAEAATYFVSSTGSETPCIQSNPCYPDLALTYADPGDTIYFMQGTYTRVSDPMLTITKGVTMMGGWDGSPTGAVVVDPEAYPTVFDGVDTYRIFEINETSGNQVTISGFTFINGYHDVRAGAIDIVNGNVDILNSSFTNNLGGSYAGAIYIATAGEVNILNNSFSGNSATYGGGHIYAGSASSGTLIEGNVFSGGSANYGAVIHSDRCNLTVNRNFIKDTGSGSVIDIYSYGPTVVISNNIIVRSTNQAMSFSGETVSPHQVLNNTLVGGTYGITPNASNLNVVNNIFYFFSVNSIGGYSGTVEGSNNLYYLNANDSHPLDNPVYADPGFVDAASDDYHINSDSPALDAGAAVVLSDDFDGDVRPLGSGYDIGADEVRVGMEVFIPILLN